MRSIIRALVCAVFTTAALTAVPTTASATTGGNTEGCTPGYWKVSQHHDSWQEADPTTKFVDAFGGMAEVGVITGDVTMLQALNFRGGSGLDGARRILARAAVAAWLNAAYDDAAGHLAFPWRRWASGFNGEPPLVPTVDAALTSGSRSQMISLARQLDAANNLGCPLS